MTETDSSEAKLATKYVVNCISCKPANEDARRATIYQDALCHVVLRTDNQCWLGRYIIAPTPHLEPFAFWSDTALQTHIMKVHVEVGRAIMQAFGAITVQMAQIGACTMDENEQSTFDQRYQHAHIHGIPRYGPNVPSFAGKQWPDPQFCEGKFQALNIDKHAGLPVVVPTSDEVQLIVKEIQRYLPSHKRNNDNSNQNALLWKASVILLLGSCFLVSVIRRRNQ